MVRQSVAAAQNASGRNTWGFGESGWFSTSPGPARYNPFDIIRDDEAAAVRDVLLDAGLDEEVDQRMAEIVLPLAPRLVDDFRHDIQVTAAGRLPFLVVADDVHVHDGIVVVVEPLPDVDSDDVAELALEGCPGNLAQLSFIHFGPPMAGAA